MRPSLPLILFQCLKLPSFESRSPPTTPLFIRGSLRRRPQGRGWRGMLLGADSRGFRINSHSSFLYYPKLPNIFPSTQLWFFGGNNIVGEGGGIKTIEALLSAPLISFRK